MAKGMGVRSRPDGMQTTTATYETGKLIVSSARKYEVKSCDFIGAAVEQFLKLDPETRVNTISDFRHRRLVAKGETPSVHATLPLNAVLAAQAVPADA